MAASSSNNEDSGRHFAPNSPNDENRNGNVNQDDQNSGDGNGDDNGDANQNNQVTNRIFCINLFKNSKNPKFQLSLAFQ